MVNNRVVIAGTIGTIGLSSMRAIITRIAIRKKGIGPGRDGLLSGPDQRRIDRVHRTAPGADIASGWKCGDRQQEGETQNHLDHGDALGFMAWNKRYND